ncbi:MAG: CvpA family protein [Eubacterium sp.]|nr:CvpA family protein [Eubacterium sp.]MBR7061066.1 CvpA family protein [Eubacterium sp.]
MTIFNYTVNYIDIMLAAIIVLFMIIGWCRGLLINVVNFIRWAFGLFISFFVSERMAGVVYENYVQPKALETINKNIVTSTNLDEILKNLQELSKNIPKFLSSSVDFGKLNVSGDDLASSILENYFEGILVFLTKAALFIAVFALFFLITGIIIFICSKGRKRREEKRGKKSAIKRADQFLGLLLGIMKGALIVFALSSVLVLILGLYEDESQMGAFMKEVNNSQLLKLIDEINPFNAITGGLL